MKKCAYFTTKNINKEAHKFLYKLIPFRNKHNYQLNLQNCALLVIDMQKLFFNQTGKKFIPSILAIVSNIKKLQKFFKKNNLFVLQTKHLDLYKNTLMLQWWKSLIKHDSESDIISELIDPQISILTKTQYDAFLYTDLEKQLKKNHIKQIIITGVMANLCCESTARTAFMKGFEVFYTIDGTAANTKSFHFASLLNLSYGFAIPILTKEILKSTNVNE